MLQDGPDRDGKPTWIKPAILPTITELNAWTIELDTALRGCTFADIARSMQGMAAAGLAFANSEGGELRQRAEVYHLVMQYVPADIVQAAALRLIASEQFMPTAARWLKECDKPLAERQRMRKRVDELVHNHKPAERARGGAYVPEPKHVRLAGMIAAFRRPKHGNKYAGNIAAHMAELWEYGNSLHPLPPWLAGGIVLRFDDGEHIVYPEPPPENAPKAAPMPFGIREPVVKPPEAIRTPETQQAIDETKRGYGDLAMAGIPPRSTSADYLDEPLGDGGE